MKHDKIGKQTTTEIHPPLPKRAELSKIVQGSIVALARKRTSGFDRIDVRVSAKTKTETGFDFLGTVLATGDGVEFTDKNILEITEP